MSEVFEPPTSATEVQGASDNGAQLSMASARESPVARAESGARAFPGLQSVRFELEPVYALRFEFREDGTALPTGPQGMHTTKDIRAVDHHGRVTDGGLQRDMIVEVSAPGLYEIDFERVTADLYHPIPPRLVEVRAGETTKVIVELRRR